MKKNKNNSSKSLILGQRLCSFYHSVEFKNGILQSLFSLGSRLTNSWLTAWSIGKVPHWHSSKMSSDSMLKIDTPPNPWNFTHSTCEKCIKVYLLIGAMGHSHQLHNSSPNILLTIFLDIFLQNRDQVRIAANLFKHYVNRAVNLLGKMYLKNVK